MAAVADQNNFNLVDAVRLESRRKGGHGSTQGRCHRLLLVIGGDHQRKYGFFMHAECLKFTHETALPAATNLAAIQREKPTNAVREAEAAP